MRLIVVEPDHLTRWSMEEYLCDMYSVRSTDNATAALALLDILPVDAIVVADDLPLPGADAVESRACSLNPRVKVVRTMTQSCPSSKTGGHTIRLEKPFSLSLLAHYLA